MKRIDNIVFDKGIGKDGLGDLFLPDNAENAPAALLIHGGAWIAMEKESIEPVARALVEAGYAVFNVNYRLIGTAPWPACGDDCLNAARFLLEAGHPDMECLNLSTISVVGGSAGGHLALMTGLRLPPDKVKAIMDISGITDVALSRKQIGLNDPSFWPTFTGGEVEKEFLDNASPRYWVTKDSPLLYCIHSTNDKLVPPEHADIIQKAYEDVDAECEVFYFDGPGEAHGLFEDGNGELAFADRILVSCVKEAIIDFFRKLSTC